MDDGTGVTGAAGAGTDAAGFGAGALAFCGALPPPQALNSRVNETATAIRAFAEETK
ncbi:MAG: hypothetical protein ABIY40_00790 [Rhodanobacteraceae bacterium]